MFIRLATLMIMSVVSCARADVVSSNAQVYRAPNGVEVVNTAPKDAQGVSHNDYSRLNVDPSGLVLNNSHDPVQSQLAGAIAGNPNGGGATLIINEVRNGPPSSLKGFIEVAGDSATVVVVNEAGITCTGCGFINAPKGILTSGKINPTGVLDAASVGAMYPDNIFIIATDAGVGMNVPATQAQNIEITQSGEVKVTRASASGALKVRGTSVTLKDSAVAGATVDISASNVVSAENSYIASKDITISAPLIDIASSALDSSGNVFLSGTLLKNRMQHYEYIKAEQVGDTVRTTTGVIWANGYDEYYTTTFEDKFEAKSKPSVISANGKVTLDFNRIENFLSHIIAGGDVDFKNSEFINQNIDLYRTYRKLHIPYQWRCKRHCGGGLRLHSREYANYALAPRLTEVAPVLLSTIYSTVTAGGKVIGGGDIANGGLTSIAAMKEGVNPNKLKADFGWDAALYKPAPGPGYLYETRPEFIDLSIYLSSDVLLNALVVSNNFTRLGDAYVETQFLKMQSLASYGDTLGDLNTLYANSIAFATSTGKQIGDKLTPAEIATLTSDIIWMELETVSGTLALVPRLYKASESSVSGAKISGKEIELTGVITKNYGSIHGSDKVTINSNLTNYAEISGKQVDITGTNIINSALVDKYTYKNGSYEIIGSGAKISGDNVNITASENLYNLGSKIDSTTSTNLSAGGNIYNAALDAKEHYSDAGKRYSANSSSTTHQGSSITSGGDVQVNAGTNIYNIGSKFSGATATFTAQQLISEHTTDTSHSDTKYTVKDWLSKYTKSTSDDSSKVNKSEISFTNGYTVNANALLTATDTIGQGTYNGDVLIKSATEYSARDVSTHGKNPIRFKDTANGFVQTSVVEGNHDSRNVYNGALTQETHKATYKDYHLKNSGFTKEAIAFVGVATTIATAGTGGALGAGMAAYVGAESAAISSAISSATSAAFVGGSSQFASNLFKNDGKVSAAFSDTFGKDGLKHIAAGSATAGLTSGFASSMGVHIDNSTLKPVSATDLEHRFIYAGVSTATKTGVDAALLGQNDTFLDNLKSTFGGQAHAAASSAIGHAYMQGDLGYAEHKAAHAIAGAAYGAATGASPLATALAPTSAEIVGEAVLDAQATKLFSQMLKMEITPEQFQEGLAQLRNDVELAGKLTGATTAFIAGDTAAGSAAASTAVENNTLQLIPPIYVAATAIITTVRTCMMNPACTRLVLTEGMAISTAIAITNKAQQEGFDIAPKLQSLHGFSSAPSESSTLSTPAHQEEPQLLSTPEHSYTPPSEGFDPAPDWLQSWGSILFNERPDTVEKFAGQYPINSKYAGQTFPLDKLPQEIRDKYPESVAFNEKGFPDFSKYAIKTVELNNLKGNRSTDYSEANRAAGLIYTPKGYTWHHVEDGKTMILIPTDIHNAVRHTGGCSLLNQKGC